MATRRRLDRRRPKRNNIVLPKRIFIFIPLVIIFLLLSSVIINPNLIGKGGNTEVKVLIYNGPETSPNSVVQIESCLDKSNTKNLTSKLKFTYTTSDKINTEILSSYDVLIMPGTDKGYDYLDSESVDGNAIKKFVYEGKGFIGICAGAYSGAKSTDGWHQGWGIAPNVVAIPALNEANLTVQITSEGKEIFGYEGEKTMSHINGPAMYSSEGKTIKFAIYKDNNTGYQGYDAIIGDYYGKGRTVLSGVHPELLPQYPEILVYLILWAADLPINVLNG